MIDMLLIIYIMVINVWNIAFDSFTIVFIAKWCVLCLCYIIIRRIANKQFVLWLIIIGGVIEALIACAQKLQWLGSNHRYFEVTGTFGNPGQLSGILSIALIFSLGMILLYWKQYKLYHRLCLLIIALCILWALILSNSRSGWVSVFVGICFIVLKYRITLIYRLCIIILFLAFFIGGYFYKKDSADGRLLIWKVTTNMIFSKPFAGYGPNGFRKHYMYFQANYFSEKENTKLFILADNVIYPYNEFLHIWVKYGLIGLFLFIIIAISALFYPSKNDIQRILKAGFLALLVYSFFSYPLSVFLLSILFPLLLGGIDSKMFFRTSCTNSHRLSFYILTILGIVISTKGYNFYFRSNDMSELLFSSNIKEKENAETFFSTNYVRIRHIPQVLDRYAIYSFQEKKNRCLSILLDASLLIPTCELFIDIGDLYVERGEIEKAKKAYILACKMIPNRIRPKYKLFFILHEENDIVNMKKVGNEILNQELKIVGTHVLKMRSKVGRVMGQYS